MHLPGLTQNILNLNTIRFSLFFRSQNTQAFFTFFTMANKIKDSKLELQRETTSLASSLSKKPISDKQKTIWSVNFEISGKVQGVFFRKHTLTQARKLGLHGWCMNTTHGTVKGVLEGPLEQITDMRYWLQHKGSPRSIIQKADFTPNQPIPNYCYKTFSIRK